MTSTQTAPTLTFQRVPHDSADTGYVRVSGPHSTTQRTTGWVGGPSTEHYTALHPGGYRIHVDKGTVAPCPVTGDYRNVHHLQHVTPEGTTLHLGGWGTWGLAEEAARIHASGVDPTTPEGRVALRGRHVAAGGARGRAGA